MIIGGDFNKQARKLLAAIAESSESNPNTKVGVEAVCQQIGIDKTEAKNLLEYLESKSLIRIHTFGGSYLYHEVFITEEGIKKAF